MSSSGFVRPTAMLSPGHKGTGDTERAASSTRSAGHGISRVPTNSLVPRRSLKIGSEADPLEIEAQRIAEQAHWSHAPSSAAPGMKDLPNRRAHALGNGTTSMLSNGGGRPLEPMVQRELGSRLGIDLSAVRIHSGSDATAAARQLHARAFTVGNDIVFGAGQYAPDSLRGRRLLIHELVHTRQQAEHGLRYVARSVDDWLTGSKDVRSMTATELLYEIDELSQWLDRQIASSAETIRLRESLNELRKEYARRETVTRRTKPRAAKAARSAHADAVPAAPRPRILIELTSVSYTDPADMRFEYDLIAQWLMRDDLSADERRTLLTERSNLATLLQLDRAQVVSERHAARLEAALGDEGQAGVNRLVQSARVIEGIAADPSNANLFYIYQRSERIAVSRAQMERLRALITEQLMSVGRRLDSDASYYWDRYHAQVAINRDSPRISAIAGWLADVKDPGVTLAVLYNTLQTRLIALKELVRAGRLVDAASAVDPSAQLGAQIRMLSRAFYEGYIEGAEQAAAGLTFVADASFVVATGIAAVVAAPLVAGYVAGAGLTGATAAVATTAGTGVVVGSGAAVVRGGSAAAGTAFAGGSWSQVRKALFAEGARGFREGFIAGAGGAFARVIGPALGVGAQVGQQALRRMAAEAIVNGTSSMIDALLQGRSPKEAVEAGLLSAAFALPGAGLGAAKNRVAQQLGGPLLAGATTYAGARVSGASPEEAIRAASIAVVTHISVSHGSQASDKAAAGQGFDSADSALEARGYAAGQHTGAAAPFKAPLPTVAPPAPSQVASSPSANVAAPEAHSSQARQSRAATAEGTGDAFSYEFHDVPTPTVETKRPSTHVTSHETTAPTAHEATAPTANGREAATTQRGYTHEEIAAELNTTSSDTASVSRSLSDPDELNVPRSNASDELVGATAEQRLRPAIGHPESIAIAKRAGLPDDFIHSGTVLTARDFADVVPDRVLPNPKRASRIGTEAEELRRGFAGRRPTSAPDPADVQHLEFKGDWHLLSSHLEKVEASVKELAINRTQRTDGPLGSSKASTQTRPDVQLAIVDANLNGKRVFIEYDRFPGTRSMMHAREILTRDPSAIVVIKLVGHESPRPTRRGPR